MISIYFQIFFTRIELVQAFQLKGEYFMDYWNCIDFTSMVLNGAYTIFILCTVFSNKLVLEEGNYRTLGSLVAFLMWIKVFYWMRLFNTPAYFINLITQTISDIRIFALLVFIIICAFANFFYILNMNTPANELYVQKHNLQDQLRF